MSAKVVITLTTPTSIADLNQILGSSSGEIAMNKIQNLLNGIAGGIYSAQVDVLIRDSEQTLNVVSTVASDLFTLANHGLVNGQTVRFSDISTITGIAIDTTYHVVGSATNTFQIALTSGGSAINLTGSDGTAKIYTTEITSGTGSSLSRYDLK
jgi:hypothetical protein